MGNSERGNVKEGWSAWWSFACIPEFPVEADKTALIVIDMTYQQAHRDYGLCKRIIEAGLEDDLSYYPTGSTAWWWPNLAQLIAAFREAGRAGDLHALRLAGGRRLRPDLAPPPLRRGHDRRLEGTRKSSRPLSPRRATSC